MSHIHETLFSLIDNFTDEAVSIIQDHNERGGKK
jgi:hypothetical protein